MLRVQGEFDYSGMLVTFDAVFFVDIRAKKGVEQKRMK